MISPEQQQQLRQRFNPDGSQLRRHQLRMLEMLDYVDQVCTRHNIRYWLSSGTCLGAIRHGGFIPWDDDVDIEMLAEDYHRLKKVIESDPDAPYYWHDDHNDPLFVFPFAKLRDPNSELIEHSCWSVHYKYQGIFIDIFRLYPSGHGWIDKMVNGLHHFLILGIARRQNKFNRPLLHFNYFIMEKIIAPIATGINRLFFKDKYRHRVGCEFPKPRYKADIEETIKVPFENLMLPVPKGYDRYLTTIYGDYMKLPNLDNLIIHTVKLTIK